MGKALTSGGVGDDNLVVIKVWKCGSVEDDFILLNVVYLEENKMIICLKSVRSR